MRTVLAIDDSKVVLMQVKKYAAATFPNCEVLTSPNPKEGIELGIANKDKIDLVIIDFNMPEMNGIEVMEELGKHISYDKMVVCTANLQKILQDKIEHSGARYLEKPLSQDKFNQIAADTLKKAS